MEAVLALEEGLAEAAVGKGAGETGLPDEVDEEAPAVLPSRVPSYGSAELDGKVAAFALLPLADADV